MRGWVGTTSSIISHFSSITIARIEAHFALWTQCHAACTSAPIEKLVAAPLFVKLSKPSTGASPSTPGPEKCHIIVGPVHGLKFCSPCMSHYTAPRCCKARFLPQPHRLLPHQSKTGRSQAGAHSFQTTAGQTLDDTTPSSST